MKMIDSELHDLMQALADSAARSDVECVALQVGNWYEPRAAYNDEKDNAVVASALRYLELREASGDPLPYKVIRDEGKVRFE